MRKLAALLMALLLVLGMMAALAEEDFSMGDILSGADPNVVRDTVVGSLSLDPGADNGEVVFTKEESIYEADGSVLITVTGTGDFTIGGDSRKRTDIFDDELQRQGGDINFTRL